MLRDLQASTRSKRKAAISRRGETSPASACSQSSRLMPITSRFSCCRQMMSQAWTRASWTCAEITARSSASSAISLSEAFTATPPSVCAHSIRKTGAHPRIKSEDMLCGIRALVADALDRRAAGRQLFFQPLKAAVEMIDAVDHGLAFGGKPRDDQGYRGAQVGRHHGRAPQHGGAVDGRGFAVERDFCTEPRQLLHVHEAV